MEIISGVYLSYIRQVPLFTSGVLGLGLGLGLVSSGIGLGLKNLVLLISLDI